MPIYDYKCENCNLIFEKIVPIAERDNKRVCPECGGTCSHIVSPVNFSLDGCSGDFPTEYDRWWKKRRQKLNIERKENGKPPIEY